MRARHGAAGASAWARYRALSAEHRLERNAARALVAGSCGLVAWGMTGARVWWTGLVVALGVFVAHLVWLRGRPGPVTDWRLGALAERGTARRLARLESGSFQTLHDRALPDTPGANLDHLVIGPTGVYAIVTRRWPRRTRIRSYRRRIWAGDRPVTGLSAAATRAAARVSGALAAELGRDVRVTAMVAVHGARLPTCGLREGKVVFQGVRRLDAYVTSRPVVFTSVQVTAIAAAADRALPPMSSTARSRTARSRTDAGKEPIGKGAYRYEVTRN